MIASAEELLENDTDLAPIVLVVSTEGLDVAWIPPVAWKGGSVEAFPAPAWIAGCGAPHTVKLLALVTASRSPPACLNTWCGN
jgi:hypothetical protein